LHFEHEKVPMNVKQLCERSPALHETNDKNAELKGENSAVKTEEPATRSGTTVFSLPSGFSKLFDSLRVCGAVARRWAKYIPNALTLGAVLCGLTAIRLSGEGEFSVAMAAIFAAAVLDVADGFAARRLSAQTAIGAELDSFADFLNFGVAPAMLLYSHHLHLFGAVGWLIVASYVFATGLRLARFNVQSREVWGVVEDKWFTGLPSTGAAVLVLIADAMFGVRTSASSGEEIAFLAGTIIVLSVLMISTVPVPSVSVVSSRARSRLSKR
jgi:CDP-diacylglycerol--serine O-phosphatidyltransferase